MRPTTDAVARRGLAGLRGPIASVAAAAVAFTVVGLVDPNQPGRYPTCPFLAVTGHYCPGCGTLRAMHALTRGDLFAAAGLNVLTLASLPVLVWIWLRWAQRSWTGTARTQLAPAALIWALAIGVVLFGLIRNLPFGAALAP